MLCVICGDYFESKRSDAKCCSAKCRKKLSRSEKEHIPSIIRSKNPVIVIKGQEFYYVHGIVCEHYCYPGYCKREGCLFAQDNISFPEPLCFHGTPLKDPCAKCAETKPVFSRKEKITYI